MNSKLFIADKVKVGFNLRSDTYTGLLGYVIGFDGKKWRKEPSWESWRYEYCDDEKYEDIKRPQFNNQLDRLKQSSWVKKEEIEKFEADYDNFIPYGKLSNNKDIIPKEFDNVPTEGFVLNKKVGGTRYSWNTRATYSRIYDPRGFEFEITIPNLLFILQECNAYKGKGLEGSFVYAWDDKNLVLLPTSSQEYQESQNFTNLQFCKINSKDLVEGGVYKTKQQEDYVYLGKFNWFKETYWNSIPGYSGKIDKRHVFVNLTTNYEFNRYVGLTSLDTIAKVVNSTPVDNYAELIDNFNGSEYYVNLSDVIISDFSIPKEIGNRRGGDDAIIYLPIKNNQFEVYKISCVTEYYMHRIYKVKSFTLHSTKTLTINEYGDFKIKKVNHKELGNLSHEAISNMGFKVLSIAHKNEKEFNLEF
jgi:hypothetical protein